ncbi:MAG: GFA family protein [Alphaproteobacteria bacterium]|nr:GFA family protein [Alphaproteobacteria bacterium]
MPCGAVETDHHVCHCSVCRRSTGGPRLAWSVGSVKFIGDEHMSRYKSSDWTERCFCPKCGSSLFYYMT